MPFCYIVAYNSTDPPYTIEKCNKMGMFKKVNNNRINFFSLNSFDMESIIKI